MRPSGNGNILYTTRKLAPAPESRTVLPVVVQTHTPSQTSPGSTSPSSGADNKSNFYPENLYRVISDFQSKHHHNNNSINNNELHIFDPSSDKTISETTDMELLRDSGCSSGGSVSTRNPSCVSIDATLLTDYFHSNWALLSPKTQNNHPHANSTATSHTTLKRVPNLGPASRDPFPRIPARTLRCRTCCDRLHSNSTTSLDKYGVPAPPSTLPTALNPQHSGVTHFSRNSANNSSRVPNQPSQLTRPIVKFIRKSYALSHFDDTYCSNELKRHKAISGGLGGNGVPRDGGSGALYTTQDRGSNNRPRWRL